MSGPNTASEPCHVPLGFHHTELNVLGGWREDGVSAVPLSVAPGLGLMTLAGLVARVVKETPGPGACWFGYIPK